MMTLFIFCILKKYSFVFLGLRKNVNLFIVSNNQVSIISIPENRAFTAHNRFNFHFWNLRVTFLLVSTIPIIFFFTLSRMKQF